MKYTFSHLRPVAGLVLVLNGLVGCQQLQQLTLPQVSAPFAATAEPKVTASAKKNGKGKKLDAAFAAARTLEKAGQFDRAEAAFAEIIKENSRYAPAHHRLAIVQARLGKVRLAEASFETALTLDPRNADLLCDHGYCLYLQGELQVAEAQFRKALQERPEFPRAALNLGLVQARIGHNDMALASFQSAGVSSSEASANLAYAMMREEKLSEAAQQLQLAMTRDPQNKTLQGRLQEMQGALAGQRLSPDNKEVVSAGTSWFPQTSSDQLPPVKVVTTASLPSADRVVPASYEEAPQMAPQKTLPMIPQKIQGTDLFQSPFGSANHSDQGFSRQ